MKNKIILVFLFVAFLLPFNTQAYDVLYPRSPLNPLQVQIVPEPGARIDELQRQTQLQAILLQQQKLQQDILQREIDARMPSNIRASNPITCQSGYIQMGDSCYTYNQKCNLSFPNSTYTGQKNTNGGLTCDCPSSYQWNSDRTSCIVKPKPVAPPVIPLPDNNQVCLRDYGVNSVWIGELNSSGGPVCRCQLDYEFNTNRTVCVARSIPNPQPTKVVELEKKEVPKPAVVEKPVATTTKEVSQPDINLAAASFAPITQVQPKSLWSRIKSWFSF